MFSALISRNSCAITTVKPHVSFISRPANRMSIVILAKFVVLVNDSFCGKNLLAHRFRAGMMVSLGVEIELDRTEDAVTEVDGDID